MASSLSFQASNFFLFPPVSPETIPDQDPPKPHPPPGKVNKTRLRSVYLCYSSHHQFPEIEVSWLDTFAQVQLKNEKG